MAGKTGNMRVKYDPDFIKTLKKLNVRIQKSFKKRLEIFQNNPDNPQLHNHPLRHDWSGYRSINITADWRAIYKEIHERDDKVTAYFIAIGTHKKLYSSNK